MCEVEFAVSFSLSHTQTYTYTHTRMHGAACAKNSYIEYILSPKLLWRLWSFFAKLHRLLLFNVSLQNVFSNSCVIYLTLWWSLCHW